MFDLYVENDDIRKKHILVEITGTSYSFGINTVKEVIPMIEIFSIAASREIIGVINLRGESVPVIDIRNILGQNNNKINAKQKLVILEINSSKLAVIVDNIVDIINVGEEHILNMPYGKNLVKTTIVDGKTIAIIDTYALFELYYSKAENKTISAGELVPVEDKSAPVIKIRTEILNRTNDYMLPQEAFLNEKFIIFRLEKEVYAFNILYVEEIKMISKNMISKVPCVPNFVKGIIDKRVAVVSYIKGLAEIIKTIYKKPIASIVTIAIAALLTYKVGYSAVTAVMGVSVAAGLAGIIYSVYSLVNSISSNDTKQAYEVLGISSFVMAVAIYGLLF